MLFRKMIRDIRGNLSQFITIILMITLGVATYAGIEGYMQGMQVSGDRFYQKNHLQDLNIRGMFSKDDIKEIQSLPGIKEVEGKIVLKIPVTELVRHKTKTQNQDEKIKDYMLELNLISSNHIASFEVEEGQGFAEDMEGVWVDGYFAKKNNLQVGDEITFSYQNILNHCRINGIIYTPDHIYYQKNESEIVPNHEKFGYAYSSYQPFLQRNNVKNKYFTQIMVSLKEGVNLDEIKAKIQEKVQKRGVVSKIQDEPTTKIYQEEIDENTSIMNIFTSFFILIAMLSVSTTMSRVIKNDRIKIGTLKALGFSNLKIMWHYISYGLFLSVIGGGVGLFFGLTLIAPLFLQRVMQFFEVPNYQSELGRMSLFVYFLIVLIISLICYLTTRNIIRQSTTKILRQDQPKISQKELKLTISRFFTKLSFTTRWNIRDILRNKGRIVTALIGITGVIALIILAFGAYTSITNFIYLETRVINNFNYRASIDGEKIQNNIKQEKIIEYKQSLTKYFPKNSSTSMVEFLTKDGQNEISNLFVDNSKNAVQFLDTKRERTSLHTDGIYISRKNALKYNFNIGEEVQWRFYGEEKYHTSKISGMLTKQQDQNFTMNKTYFESLGLKYQPDSFYLEKIPENNSLTEFLLIQPRKAIEDSLRKMLDMMIIMLIISIILAIFLGIVIIYNTGTLSFIEQDFQFATMKVLGFTNKQLSIIFTRQNIWIAMVASLIGMPLGVVLTEYIFKVSVAEIYDIRTHITPIAFIAGVIGTFCLTILISKKISKKVKKIDMVKALKNVD